MKNKRPCLQNKKNGATLRIRAVWSSFTLYEHYCEDLELGCVCGVTHTLELFEVLLCSGMVPWVEL